MNKMLLLVVSVLLLGCAGLSKQPFVIQTNQEDKFSDKSSLQIYSFNNRISTKSVSGGQHIDAGGVYVNPAAFITKNGDIGVSLSVKNISSVSTGGVFSAYQTIFSPIKEIIFLVNGVDRISIILIPKDYNVGATTYIASAQGYSTDISELSQGEIKLDDFRKIVNATSMDVKIIGGKTSQTYNNNELEKDFIPNLKQFYDRLNRSK